MAELGSAFLRAFIKTGLRLVPGGAVVEVMAELTEPLADAGWEWLKTLGSPAQRQRAITELAHLPVENARALTLEEARNAGVDLARAEALANYVSVIPMMARKAITQLDDRGKPQTQESQLPNRRLEMLRFLPLRPPMFQPGQRVPGRDYKLTALVGQGGFGEVWRAEHLYEERVAVAVKFCNVETQKEEHRAALENEMRVVRSMHRGKEPSPYIVALLDTGLSSEPPFLVYEFIDGGDLVTWLAQFEGKPPPPKQVVAIMMMIARGLQKAHSEGVVHRDLKPANVLVTREGVAKITDFGIGRLDRTERTDGATRFATALQGASTPLYADPQGAEDNRYDIYSLGVIAFQLLVGDVTRAVSLGELDDLAAKGVPGRLRQIVSRCLTSPERRYQTAKRLHDELQELLEGRGEDPLPTPPPPPPPPSPQKNIKPLLIAGAALVGILGFAALIPKSDGDGPKPEPTPIVEPTPTPPDPVPTKKSGSGIAIPDVPLQKLDLPKVTDWFSLVSGQSCDTPCCGGEYCPVSDENRGHGACANGMCTRCGSPFLTTCIPGSCDQAFEPTEAYFLHLNGVQAVGETLDPCAHQDFRVCLTPASTGKETCFAQKDVCASSNQASPAGARFLGSDFRTALDVRITGRDGEDRLTFQGYKEGLFRNAMCIGWVLRLDRNVTRRAPDRLGASTVRFWIRPDTR